MWKDFDDVSNLGWTKNYKNLWFTLVRNAGHLVPSDQPRTAWLMLGKYFVR
jgi:carboxypeptidase C (cathepsin A)